MVDKGNYLFADLNTGYLETKKIQTDHMLTSNVQSPECMGIGKNLLPPAE